MEMSQVCPELAGVTFMTDPSSAPVVPTGERGVGQHWVMFQEVRALRWGDFGEVLPLPSVDLRVFSREWGGRDEP